jgi:hypothetical protein
MTFAGFLLIADAVIALVDLRLVFELVSGLLR